MKLLCLGLCLLSVAVQAASKEEPEQELVDNNNAEMSVEFLLFVESMVRVDGEWVTAMDTNELEEQLDKVTTLEESNDE